MGTELERAYMLAVTNYVNEMMGHERRYATGKTKLTAEQDKKIRAIVDAAAENPMLLQRVVGSAEFIDRLSKAVTRVIKFKEKTAREVSQQREKQSYKGYVAPPLTAPHEIIQFLRNPAEFLMQSGNPMWTRALTKVLEGNVNTSFERALSEYIDKNKLRDEVRRGLEGLEKQKDKSSKKAAERTLKVRKSKPSPPYTARMKHASRVRRTRR